MKRLTLAALAVWLLPVYSGIAFGADIASGAAVPTVSPVTLVVDATLHFDGADGKPITLELGSYAVEANDAALRLTDGGGNAFVVTAQAAKHDQQLIQPVALIVAVGDDERHLVLLQPDGTRLEAIGSASGIRSRGGMTRQAVLSNVELRKATVSMQPVQTLAAAPQAPAAAPAAPAAAPPLLTQAISKDQLRQGRPDRKLALAWSLRPDEQPSIGSNSEILLFIHGMDSRAEEADDITRALFREIASPSATPMPVSSPAANPMVPVLNQLLQKYKSCILEKYETQQDMINRGLPANASGLATANGLQPRDTVTCVAGNQCTLASRTSGFAALQAQANSGNPTNFQINLERRIPKDCFACTKHAEQHTKHVHCTMEAGGNSGFQGPYFEGCKAGVDMEALARQISQEIAGVIQNITNNPAMVPDVTGGPSIATNHVTVSFKACPNPASGCPETCDNPDAIVNGKPTAVVPPGYFEPMVPTVLLDGQVPNFNVPAAHNIGPNEGRLTSELRQAARAAAMAPDPGEILKQAASQFAMGDSVKGNAFADLSVTGRRSFETFIRNPPTEALCQSIAQALPQPDADRLANGCRTALDRAYRVANFLRTGQRGDTPGLKAAKTNERNALGWIAVSGEDDSPHRPVNVPSSDFPQYDLVVPVEAPMAPPGLPKTINVRTRYTIAQFRSPVSGRNLVMISLDLPTSGYADNLDYNQVSALSDIGTPKWTPLPIPVPVPPGIDFLIPGGGIIPPGTLIPPGTPLPDFQATGRTPLLDFIETFIVRFADNLEQKVPIKGQIKAVMGGSLGGNMTFRLGRRPNVPWLPSFVVWSPASVWTSLGAGPDIFKHFGVRTAWESANGARNSPGVADRAKFFGSWDKPILPVLIPMAQSDTWTSDFYRCKKSSVAGARLDRQETYDQNFLAWHWRLGGEQLLFSHSNIDPATGRPLYMLNQKPMLLACGLEDRVRFNDICPATQSTALKMTLTPGKALFLDQTGHSLDNERRSFWAQQMVAFLGL